MLGGPPLLRGNATGSTGIGKVSPGNFESQDLAIYIYIYIYILCMYIYIYICLSLSLSL